MRTTIFASILFVLFLGFIAAGMSFADESAAADADEGQATTPSDVVDLTAANFDETVAKHEFALIEFYAPWCPHCKKLVPEYDKTATELKEKNILVAKVDCDAEKQMAQRFEVPGFPSIKLFKNGKPFRDYEDERTAEAMIRWVIKKTGPSAVSLSSKSELDEHVAKSTADQATGSTVVAGFFASKDSDEYKQFLATADSSDVEDFTFVEVSGDAAKELLADGATGSVKMFRHFEPKEVAYTGSVASDELVKFIKQNGYPLVDEINGKTFRRFAESNLPLVIAFLDMDQKDEFKQTIDTLTKVAEATVGKLQFGYSDGKTYGQQLEIMGGNKEKLPGVAAMDIQKRQNFPYLSGEMTVESLLAWANGIISGEIKPHLRSEAVPAENNEPVKIVVGKSFQDIVMDDSKDVLLEIYAPWCGHCKKLAPIYDDLAKFFGGVKNLVIAKLDGTQNDTPLQIEGFPTLHYFPAGKKAAPVEYQGSRSLKDLKKFIQKHASESIKAEVDALMPKKKQKKGEASKQATEQPPKDEL